MSVHNRYHDVGLLLAGRLVEARTEVEDRQWEPEGRTLGPVLILRRRQLKHEIHKIIWCMSRQ